MPEPEPEPGTDVPSAGKVEISRCNGKRAAIASVGCVASCGDEEAGVPLAYPTAQATKIRRWERLPAERGTMIVEGSK
jgi:hypothetical protein